jgi:hypothetical protein
LCGPLSDLSVYPEIFVTKGGSLSFLGLSLSISRFSFGAAHLSFAKARVFDYNSRVDIRDIVNTFHQQIKRRKFAKAMIR